MDNQNHDELLAELSKLQTENEALRSKMPHAPGLTLKVSAKGALSIYGLGRFPVTLYRSQAESLIAYVPKIQEFIAANESKLVVKAPKA
jgi:hypothetical protein